MSSPQSRTKVLFVVPNLGKGGAERVVSTLLHRIDRERFEPVALFFDSNHVHPVPDDVRALVLDIPGAKGAWAKLTRFFRRAARIRAEIRRERPDAVVSFLNRVNLAVILACVGTGARLWVSERNTPSAELRGARGALLRALMALLYPRARGVIAVSEGVRRDLIETIGLRPSSVRVIHNPLDAERVRALAGEKADFPAEAEIRWIVNVGSLTPKKDHATLLRAFAKARGRIDCGLLILGEGPLETELKRLASVLGVADRVKFAGYRPNPFAFVARCSAFVLSSTREGFPNVLLEAMACGVPVVSTRCPSGPEEIIEDGVSGRLVPVGDGERMAEAIVEVLSDTVLRERFVREQAKVVERYSVPRILAKYQELIAEGGPR